MKNTINEIMITKLLQTHGISPKDAQVPERCRILLINKDRDKIAMIRRVREDEPEYFTFPGGGIDKEDKSCFDAMLRETKEELNLEASDYDIIKEKIIVGQGEYRYDLKGQKFIYWTYLAVAKTDKIKMVGPELLRDKGVYEAVWVPLNEIKNTNIRNLFLKDIVVQMAEFKSSDILKEKCQNF